MWEFGDDADYHNYDHHYCHDDCYRPSAITSTVASVAVVAAAVAVAVLVAVVVAVARVPFHVITCRPAAQNVVGHKEFIGIRWQAMGGGVRMADGCPIWYDS